MGATCGEVAALGETARKLEEENAEETLAQKLVDTESSSPAEFLDSANAVFAATVAHEIREQGSALAGEISVAVSIAEVAFDTTEELLFPGSFFVPMFGCPVLARAGAGTGGADEFPVLVARADKWSLNNAAKFLLLAGEPPLGKKSATACGPEFRFTSSMPPFIHATLHRQECMSLTNSAGEMKGDENVTESRKSEIRR